MTKRGRCLFASTPPPHVPIWLVLLISLGLAGALAMLPARGYSTTWLTPLPPDDFVESPTPQGLVLARGGRFEGKECGVVLVFPDGALHTDVVATCWQEGPGADMPPGALREPFNVDVWVAATSDRVTTFGAPVDLYATYSDQEIAGMEETGVGLARYDRMLERWELVNNIFLDTAANTITFRFEELTASRFALVDCKAFASPLSTTTQTAIAAATHTSAVTPTDAVVALVGAGRATATRTDREPAPTSAPTPDASTTPTALGGQPASAAFAPGGPVPWSIVLRWFGILGMVVAGCWFVLRIRQQGSDDS